MRLVRVLLLSLITSTLILAVNAHRASAQFVPDIPTGGTAARPNNDRTTSNQPGIGAFDFGTFTGFQLGRISTVWWLPAWANRPTQRLQWVSPQRRHVR